MVFRATLTQLSILETLLCRLEDYTGLEENYIMTQSMEQPFQTVINILVFAANRTKLSGTSQKTAS